MLLLPAAATAGEEDEAEKKGHGGGLRNDRQNLSHKDIIE
jgi:hypothetical protein